MALFIVELPDEMHPRHAFFSSLKKALAELENESDRGVALFGASVLDESLKTLLSNYLLDGKPKQNLMSGFNAPLGSFSSRINLAAALGLITPEEYDNCLVIKAVRNAFAHELTFELNFGREGIQKHCRKFKFQADASSYTDALSVRLLFIAAFFNLFVAWNDRLNYAAFKRPTVYQENIS